MSAGSASPPTDQPPSVDRIALERLIGVRSSKPSFYAAWRDKSERLDHTIETLERISSALCTAPAGPVAVCDAVVEAAAYHFGARWSAMVFSEAAIGDTMPRVIVHASHSVIQRWAVAPRILATLAEQTLAAQRPMLADHDEGLEFGGEPCVIVTAPMPVRGEPAGILAVGLPDGVEVAPSDVSILVTLANHAGVALHNASLFQENERRAAELERRGSELEGTLRRLEQAGRRQLLSEERNRIARELHDSVSQHLLTIGMNLEWCRRHESTSPAVLERVLAAQSLARSSMNEIREVIFGLASDGQIELPRALREVIEDVEAGTRLEVGLRVYGQTPAGARRHPARARADRARGAVQRGASCRGAACVGHAPLAAPGGVPVRRRRRLGQPPQAPASAVPLDAERRSPRADGNRGAGAPTRRRHLVRAAARRRRQAEGRGAAGRIGWPRLRWPLRLACCWSMITRSSAAGCARSSSSSPTSPWWPRPSGRSDALAAIDRAQPDIVLLDLKLSSDHDAEGLELCSEILERRPDSNVVILSTFLNEDLLNQALRRGAKAYVLKEVDVVELVRIIRAVSRGGTAFDGRSAALVRALVAGEGATAEPAFTDREREVTRLLARGLTNREIGGRIFVSESTAKFHVRNVMRKLGVHSRAEVAYAAGKRGLLDQI